MQNERIRDAVEALPEKYQYIYRHPELSQNVSRGCTDREKEISKIIRNLQIYEGRKELYILDIGCAQGYYSLTLASMGCKVSGIDYLESNIEVCNLLKEENGFTNCEFQVGMLTPDFVENLNKQYDVILVLSVMHHVATQNGFIKAREILERLSEHSKIIIAEMAVKEESVYWNKNLPEEYESWYKNICFFDEIAFFATHLTNVQRPLIISSSQILYLNEKIYAIDSYSNKAFGLKREDPAKRYYRSGDLFIKLIRASREENITELKNEISFLSNNQDISFVKPIIDCETGAHRSYLIREYEQGELLLDIISNEQKCEMDQIFIHLLDQLIELEEHGFYHGDLRLWNIICNPESNEVSLIDFGNMYTESNDQVIKKVSGLSSYSVYDAFMAVIYDALTKKEYPYITSYNMYEPSYFFDLSALDASYRTFFKSYLLERESINFIGIREKIIRYVINKEKRDFSPSEERRLAETLLVRCYDTAASRVDLKAEKNQIMREVLERQQRIEYLITEQSDAFTNLIDGKRNESITEIKNLRDEYLRSKGKLSNLEILQEETSRKLMELKEENQKLKNEISQLQNWIVLRLYRKLRGQKN